MPGGGGGAGARGTVGGIPAKFGASVTDANTGGGGGGGSSLARGGLGGQQAKPPRGAGGSAFARAFGSVLQTAEVPVQGKSKYAAAAKAAVLDKFDEDFRQLTHRLTAEEQVEDKMTSTTSIQIKTWYCGICTRLTEQKNKGCEEANHGMELRQTTKYFLKCVPCGARTYALGKPSKSSCDKCHAPGPFTACGMKEASKNKAGVLANVHCAAGLKVKEDEIMSLKNL
jgi:hypothetical protein